MGKGGFGSGIIGFILGILSVLGLGIFINSKKENENSNTKD